MKTLRYFNLAAFALATMFATACGGDDKQEGKLDNGQTCSADSNCKSGKCGDDNKCVEKSDISNDKKENGEICTKDDDCKSDYCDEGGKCATKPAAPNDKKENGKICTKDDDCKSDYCDEGGKCATKPAAPNDKKENGEICTKDDDCKSGYCDDDDICVDKPNDSGPGIIEENALAELGTPCSTDSECKSKFCNPYSTVCVNEADKDKKLESGKSCQTDNYCESNNCVNFKCVDKSGANGSSCDDIYDCDSYYCNEGKCEAFTPQPNGTECIAHEDCASGYCTEDSFIGQCADKAPQNNGESCKINDECKSQYCDKGTMKCADKPAAVEPKENGASCETHINCKSNYCNAESKCADEPKGLPRGASCTSNAQCSTNYCYNNVCIYRAGNQGYGEDCDSDLDCGTQNRCIGHKCWNGMASSTMNGTCQNVYKCGYGYVCKISGYIGKCGYCEADTDCANDYGSDYKCHSQKCSLGKAGDTCTKDSECESNVCLAGTNRCAIVNYENYRCESNKDCESKGTGLACAKAVNLCVLNDACKDVQCGSGEMCYMGRCVHAAKEGAACNDEEKSFCLVNKIVKCVSGHYVVKDCKAEGMGACAVFGENGSDIACVGAISTSTAVCAYIKQHTTTGSNGIGEACSSDKKSKYGVMCQEDVNGWLFARPSSDPTACEDNKTCVITEGDDFFATTATCE